MITVGKSFVVYLAEAVLEMLTVADGMQGVRPMLRGRTEVEKGVKRKRKDEEEVQEKSKNEESEGRRESNEAKAL